jgi:LysR family transcriptional regulator, hypochlorite-specific transcription factor HypT
MTLDLAYLLDFKALAETGSFSRAAFARNVTQPAFSRRIRALEDWVGAPLFNRGGTPVTLTNAGRAIEPAFEQAMRGIMQGQADARAAAARESSALHFAATHVLSFTFFPNWLRGLEGGQPLEAIQLSSDTLSACEGLIQEGRVQFLLCHHHAAAPVRLDPSRFLSIRVGSDTLSLVAAPEKPGVPRFIVREDSPGNAPYLQLQRTIWPQPHRGRRAARPLRRTCRSIGVQIPLGGVAQKHGPDRPRGGLVAAKPYRG